MDSDTMLSLRPLVRLAFAAVALPSLAAAQIALPTTVYDGSGGPLLGGTVYTATSVTIPTGQTLTVEPGAMLKLNGRVYVYGTLDAQGTALDPIQITSLADDSVGGDTDGSPTPPAPGDWQGVVFYAGSSASILAHAELAYHGGSSYSGLYFAAADSAVSASNLVIRDGANHGIDFNSHLTTPAISNCDLRDNAGHAVFDAHINTLPGLTDCTASGNGLGDVPSVSNGSQVGDVSLTAANTIGGVVNVASSMNIGAGETLSVGPGVIIKFSVEARVYVNGTLTALGTSVEPVSFTSIADDALGGDTNKDGGASLPLPGDWQGVAFYAGSSASVLDHVELAYHGGSAYSGLYFAATDSAISASNVVSRNGSNHGVDFNRYATTATLSALDLRDNAGHAMFDMHINSLPGLSDCTASGNGLGDVPFVSNGSQVGDVTLIAANTIGGVVSLGDSVNIGATETLSVGPGVTFKFAGNYRVYVYGTLDAQGTVVEPVRFTSIADDALGGDTNKDGGASLPLPGDWQGVAFYAGSSASVLDHVELAYHGGSAYSGLYFAATDSAISASNVVSRNGSNHGVDFNRYATTATLSALDLRDNAGHAMFDMHINSLPGLSDCTASGNGLGDVPFVSNGSQVGDVTLIAANTIGGVINMADSAVIDAGETLSLDAGVILKFSVPARVYDYGTLSAIGTADAPVVFTSIADDAHGGDTNKDGATSSPAPGDWQGLQILVGSVDTTLRHVLTRYGGASGLAGISSTSSSTVLDRVRVEHCAVEGFELSAAAVADGLVAYQCLDGIVLKGGSFDLRRSTVADCTARGVVASAAHSGAVASTVSYGSPTNWDGFTASQVVLFCGGTGVPPGTAVFNGDPLFFDAPNGDLRLSAGSACIDAGELGDFTKGLDIGGFPRRADGDLNGLPRLDMGAHEYSNLELTLTGSFTPGGQADFTLDGEPGFVATWMVFGLGFQEFNTPVGSMFTDFGQFTLILGWPKAPSAVPVALPIDLPAPFDLVLQAAARGTAGVPQAVSTSNPVRITIE